MSVWVGEKAGCELEIVKRAKGERWFTVIPRRWVMEQKCERTQETRHIIAPPVAFGG